MTANRRNPWFYDLFCASVLIFAVAVLLWSYAPIQSGSIQFDDGPSLHALANIRTADDAVEFVTGGIAGPAGRPLALASFLPHASLWPDVPQVFLRENLLIHSFNMLLVAWLTIRVSLAMGSSNRIAAWSGIVTASLWATTPLLASTSYLIVQRMTSLAACFSLLGLLGYVYGHQLWLRSPRAGLALMALSLAGGTLLATLCKENGALTPVFALCLTTLLKAPPSPERRWFTIAFMWGPLAFICAYLLYRIPHWPVGVREFDALQRLMTEAVILWQYLWRVLVPNGFVLGPFHDFRAALTPWYAAAGVASLAAWLVILVSAIRFRHNAPLFAFAVFWYLGGHLLESTTLPLELYFEHRNYLPLVGPFVALGITITRLSPGQGRLYWPLAVLFMALQVVVLNNVTRTVGNPVVAATLWHDRYPASTRAAQFATDIKLNQGRPDAAQSIIDSAYALQSTEISLWLQKVQLRCINGYDDEIATLISESPNNLRTGRFNFSVLRTLENLADQASRGTCKSVTHDTLLRITGDLLKNPRYQAPWVSAVLHHFRSQHHSRPQDMLVDLEKAWALVPMIESALSLVVVMRNVGRDCDARRFLEKTLSEPPARWSGATLKENGEVLQQYLTSIPSDACSAEL
jgi:protein O-mannosyl-transferase